MANFLADYWRRFMQIFQQTKNQNVQPDQAQDLIDGLSCSVIGGDEDVTRYVFERGVITLDPGKPHDPPQVKYGAFLPLPNKEHPEQPGRLETSVYRISNVATESIIWDLGKTYVAPYMGKKSMKGRADLSAAHIVKCSFALEAWPAPHWRHANILGWSAEESNRQLKASELALAATAVKVPKSDAQS